ncbi:hypothetical protein KIN20_012140 [Parelaphostrongylus tenuis]|uniref:Uncharacterized protein n=1 Tax=Parelaphostrongylus tenuis TaxID=148309 RepID=A0AAD5MWK1_PARTN|nr:hypothetical protein KIN20_012140 [Parelaphostrongylus tenuis]
MSDTIPLKVHFRSRPIQREGASQEPNQIRWSMRHVPSRTRKGGYCDEGFVERP